ncbi:L-threonylcarbamoyladenylate synthase [Nonomuraea thailandensis]
MGRRFDCSDPDQRAIALMEAAAAVRRGDLVVLPTDTVYGIGADAFTATAVKSLLDAKGRGRDMPPPVLVGTVRAATALVEDLGAYGQDLIDAFWPGPLTLVCKANRALSWDLGDTKGTVAIRMPLHPVALDLLKETGPMAVSSANRSGSPAATTAQEAEEQLGDSVEVYLDGGRTTDNTLHHPRPHHGRAPAAAARGHPGGEAARHHRVRRHRRLTYTRCLFRLLSRSGRDYGEARSGDTSGSGPWASTTAWIPDWSVTC